METVFIKVYLHLDKMDVWKCNYDCGDCFLTDASATEIFTILANSLISKYGKEIWEDLLTISHQLCPNLSSCHYCSVDDFCHAKKCTGYINEIALPIGKSPTKTD